MGITYDSWIMVNMQSANGEVDQSLGLVKNIPFTFRGITLYLQVHVIWSLAYDILLGHPFDVLTFLVVHNYVNEDQMLTITDPNSGEAITVPMTLR